MFETAATITLFLFAIVLAPLIALVWAGAMYVAFFRALKGYAKSFRKFEQPHGFGAADPDAERKEWTN